MVGIKVFLAVIGAYFRGELWSSRAYMTKLVVNESSFQI